MTTAIKLPPKLVGFPVTEYRIQCVEVLLKHLGPSRIDVVTNAYCNLGVEKGTGKETVYRSLKVLLARGVVAKYADPEDKRATLWGLA